MLALNFLRLNLFSVEGTVEVYTEPVLAHYTGAFKLAVIAPRLDRRFSVFIVLKISLLLIWSCASQHEVMVGQLSFDPTMSILT